MNKLFWYVISFVFLAVLTVETSYARGGGGHRSSGRSYHSSSKSGSVSVRGYHRKNGTYVAAHHRSRPNKSKYDNWSSKGNINPYTGKVGTKNP